MLRHDPASPCLSSTTSRKHVTTQTTKHKKAAIIWATLTSKQYIAIQVNAVTHE
jgi:hypothetical protein